MGKRRGKGHRTCEPAGSRSAASSVSCCKFCNAAWMFAWPCSSDGRQACPRGLSSVCRGLINCRNHAPVLMFGEMQARQPSAAGSSVTCIALNGAVCSHPATCSPSCICNACHCDKLLASRCWGRFGRGRANSHGATSTQSSFNLGPQE